MSATGLDVFRQNSPHHEYLAGGDHGIPGSRPSDHLACASGWPRPCTNEDAKAQILLASVPSKKNPASGGLVTRDGVLLARTRKESFHRASTPLSDE